MQVIGDHLGSNCEDALEVLLSNPQVSDSGNYTVTVSNSAGSVTSAPAVLTVRRKSPRSNDADKVAVSLAQDLSVLGISPFGSVCKLLVALESARSTIYSETDEQRISRRLLGGLALSF